MKLDLPLGWNTRDGGEPPEPPKKKRRLSPSVPVWKREHQPKFARCGSCGADREAGEPCVFCGPTRRVQAEVEL